MRSRHDNAELSQLRDRIVADPRGDYDDALFHTLLRACALGKEVVVLPGHVSDHGKRYVRALLAGDGRILPLRSLILSFADDNVDMDGFMLEDVAIEKGFIEEIISGLDMSGVDATVDDWRSYEADAVILFDGSYEGISIDSPDINADIVIHASPSDSVHDIASSLKSAFDAMRERNMHTASIPLIGDNPGLIAAVAMSAVDAFSAVYQDHPLSVTLVSESDELLSSILS